jgi:hypothetical protein
VGACERGEPTIEAFDEILARPTVAQRLVRHGLNDGQRILDPVRELAQQQSLPQLPGFALGDIAGALEHEAVAAQWYEFDPTFDGELAAVLRPMREFATPVAPVEQLSLELGER